MHQRLISAHHPWLVTWESNPPPLPRQGSVLTDELETNGAPPEIRTQTVRILRPLPLPIGIEEHVPGFYLTCTGAETLEHETRVYSLELGR